MFIIGKILELIGMSLLGAGLYVGCVNPYGLSEGGAMGAEVASLVVGILIFLHRQNDREALIALGRYTWLSKNVTV